MAETLKEYLVRLGFSVDKAQEARFVAALGSLSKTVAGIAASLSAAATSIVGTVTAVAASFDHLYFAAQRTNASVTSIKSLSYALSQVGGSSETALAAIEGVAAAMRTNPGTEALLNQLGVATRENGRLRETGSIIDDIVKSLASKPYYVSAQFASILGMPDEKSWNTFTTQWPKIREFQKEYEEKAKSFGLDPDKAADSSNRLMTSFRSLMGTVDLLMQKVTIELQPILTQYLETISKWISEHQTEIVAVLEGVVRAVGKLATAFSDLVSSMSPVVDTFGSLAKALGPEKGGLEWALESVLVFMALTWVPKMLGFLGRVGGTWAAVALALGYAMNGSTGKFMAQAGMGATSLGPGETTAPVGSGDPFNAYMEKGGALGQAWQWVKKKFGFGSSVGRNAETRGLMRGDGGGPGLAKITTKSGQTAWVAKDVAPQFQGFIDDLEATGYVIKDLGGFSNRNIAGTNKPSHHSTGSAIDINPRENDLGTGTGNLPPNTAELAKKWGLGWGANWQSKNDPMHFSTGGNEGGRVMSPEEVDRLRGLKDKSSYLMDPAPLGSAVNRSATISAKTDIVIYGSSDPAGTSALLGGGQSRVASELLRNAQSAFA